MPTIRTFSDQSIQAVLTVLTPAQFLAAVSEVTPALDKNPDEGVPKCQNAIMPIFEITEDALVPIKETTFSAEGIKERGDLQQLLKTNIGAIAPECYVLAEEAMTLVSLKKHLEINSGSDRVPLSVVRASMTADVRVDTFDEQIQPKAHEEYNPEKTAAGRAELRFPLRKDSNAALNSQTWTMSSTAISDMAPTIAVTPRF